MNMHRRSFLWLSRERSYSGFALVIALGLMSFIVLLLLSLTAFVRVETRISQQSLQTLAAQQNALLGMHVALGKLQELTGPDQRITTSAALFEEEMAIQEPHWIGVWQSNPEIAAEDPQVPLGTTQQRAWDGRNANSKLSSARDWLVSRESGAEPDPLVGAPGGIVMRHLANGETVRADRLLLDNGAGAFAFHVSDESLKARINLTDPHRNNSDTLIAEQAALVAQRFAPEAVLDGNDLARLPAGFDWSSLQTLSQVGLFGIDSTPLEEVFTTTAASVLANVREGGLRRDFTAIARLPSRPATTAGESSFGYGITVDRNALPQELRDNPYLYTIDDLRTETVGGSLPRNPNVGDLDKPIQGPRIEALWDFMNHDRLISGGRVRPNEAGTFDWLDLLDGKVSSANRLSNGRWLKFEGPTALFSARNFGASPNRIVDYFQPFEAMALGNKLFFGAGQPNDLELIPARHLLVNSGLTPILTELIYYITVSVEGGELILGIHPAAEYSNPYDVAIRMDTDLWWANLLLRLSVDIKLIPKDPVAHNIRVWSLEMFEKTKRSGLTQLGARSLGSLLASFGVADTYNEAQSDGTVLTREGRVVTDNASVSLIVRQPRPVFQPGETKGFVALQGAGTTVLLQEGAEWWKNSLPVKVREFEYRSVSNQASVVYGKPWPQFDPAKPTEGTSLDDYEFIEVRVNSIPVNSNLHSLDWQSSGGSQIGGGTIGSSAVRMSYHSMRIPLSRDRIGAESQIGSGLDVGNAYVYETLFQQEGGSWATTPMNPAGSDIAVIQLQALSAEDFRSGRFGIDGMNDGAENFLGRSNPRAYIMNDSHGFGGERNFEVAGWTSAFYSGFNMNLEQIGFWGEDNRTDSPNVLFHVPRRQPLSMGLLQHWNTSYATNDPAYLVGSSLPPFANLARNETVAFKLASESYTFRNQSEYDFSGTINVTSPFRKDRADFIFDSAFYLNRALWDSWFFSTIPDTVDPEREILPNSRFTILKPDEPDIIDALLAFDRAAGSLLLRGGFNINSTSEKAWGAVLAAQLGLGLNGRSGASGRLYYPRMPGMTSGSNVWSNARPIDLSDIYQDGQENNAGANTLSKRIVQEIRERGPFLSLSHFINRLLVDDERGQKGALQAALEASSVNDGNNGFDYAPGSVTQADILGPLGPALMARGDTFVIRTVGEVRDPATGSVVSRSWAEATVQRRPDYVDATNPPEFTPRNGGSLSPLNQRFGRRYEVIAFRWIDEPQPI